MSRERTTRGCMIPNKLQSFRLQVDGRGVVDLVREVVVRDTRNRL